MTSTLGRQSGGTVNPASGQTTWTTANTFFGFNQLTLTINSEYGSPIAGKKNMSATRRNEKAESEDILVAKMKHKAKETSSSSKSAFFDDIFIEKKKKKKEIEAFAKETKLKKRRIEEVIPKFSGEKSVLEAVFSKPSQKWIDDGLGGKFNNEGYTGRVEDGVKVFKAHVLNRPTSGSTKDCPFDCQCCFI